MGAEQNASICQSRCLTHSYEIQLVRKNILDFDGSAVDFYQDVCFPEFCACCFLTTYMPKMFEAVWSLPVLVLLIHQKYCWSKKDHNLFRVPQESYKDHFKADQGFSSSSGKHHDMIPWLLGCPGKNILVLPQVRHGRTADSKPKRGEVKCMLVVLMKPPTSGVYWIYWNWLCPTTGVPPLVCRKILQRWSS